MVRREYSAQTGTRTRMVSAIGDLDGVNERLYSPIPLGQTKGDFAVVVNGVMMNSGDYDYTAPNIVDSAVGPWPIGVAPAALVVFVAE